MENKNIKQIIKKYFHANQITKEISTLEQSQKDEMMISILEDIGKFTIQKTKAVKMISPNNNRYEDSLQYECFRNNWKSKVVLTENGFHFRFITDPHGKTAFLSKTVYPLKDFVVLTKEIQEFLEMFEMESYKDFLYKRYACYYELSPRLTDLGYKHKIIEEKNDSHNLPIKFVLENGVTMSPTIYFEEKSILVSKGNEYQQTTLDKISTQSELKRLIETTIDQANDVFGYLEGKRYYTSDDLDKAVYFVHYLDIPGYTTNLTNYIKTKSKFKGNEIDSEYLISFVGELPIYCKIIFVYNPSINTNCCLNIQVYDDQNYFDSLKAIYQISKEGTFKEMRQYTVDFINEIIESIIEK